MLRNLSRYLYKKEFPLKNSLMLIYKFLRYLRRRTGIPYYKSVKVDGVNFRLDLNELIDYSIYLNGYFEKNTHNAIKKIVKQGMFVIDIGANIGAHSFNLAKYVGNKGSVLAIEPSPWAFKKLSRNFDLNNFSNLSILNVGLSNKTELSKVHFRSSWPIDKKSFSRFFSQQVKETDDISAKVKDKTRLFKLDDLLNNEKRKVNFIKLDVDGYELKILKGAKKTLLNDSPKILMELCPSRLEACNDNLENLIDFLIDLEYKFFSELDFTPFPDKTSIMSFTSRSTSINVVLSKEDNL